VVYYAILIALGIVLLAILVHFAYVLSRAFTLVEPTAPAGRVGSVAARRDAAWHLAEAHGLSAAGRYPEALAHRFMALVLELEQGHALRFHAAKTPAEYAAEARLDEHGRRRLRTLVLILYRHLFAAVPCSVSDWIAFDRAAGELAAEVRVAAG
jgi:hypothetical protein